MKPDPVARAPSKMRDYPLTSGAIGAGGASTLAVWLLSLFGIAVPAEVAAPLGSALAGLVAWFIRRRGRA